MDDLAARLPPPPTIMHRHRLRPFAALHKATQFGALTIIGKVDSASNAVLSDMIDTPSLGQVILFC